MDKLNLANWIDVFSRTEQQVLFVSDRYTDIRFRFEEPGLISGFIQSVSTPNMQLTEFFLNAGKPFQLVEEETKETAESVFDNWPLVFGFSRSLLDLSSAVCS